MAAPMPREPPVTTATFPSSRATPSSLTRCRTPFTSKLVSQVAFLLSISGGRWQSQREDGMNGNAGPVIGTMAVGLASYWPQFAGMRETVLEAYGRVNGLLAGRGRVIEAGLVDDARSA